ncbi:uncharacterized protein P884DRAFT_112318 [Thermothelomyces heterothallicus CBS 202.75]|uniref:uncharacterized protein n=1 Tax=Thermothelomyces heterothallicus CBS 202.75 TaxID=1149848 RepID=UPI003744AAFD
MKKNQLLCICRHTATQATRNPVSSISNTPVPRSDAPYRQALCIRQIINTRYPGQRSKGPSRIYI